MEKNKKQKDILEDIKEIDKMVKIHLLRENIGEIKKMAKDIIKIKKKTELILEDIGIDNDDIKRIIDFVNSLDSTKLTDDNISELKKEVKNRNKEKKEKIEENINDNIYQNQVFYNSQLSNLATINDSSSLNITDGSNATSSVNISI
jgi:transcriptional regulator with AAA-type ATPase domain